MNESFNGLVIFEIAESPRGGNALIHGLLALAFGRFFGGRGTVQDFHEKRDSLRVAGLTQRGERLALDLKHQGARNSVAAEKSFGGAGGSFVLGEIARVEIGLLKRGHGTRILETSESFDGAQTAQGVGFGRGRRRQDVHRRVLVTVTAAVLFGFLQRTESARALIAVIAVTQHQERVGLTDEFAEMKIAAGDVVPEVRATGYYQGGQRRPYQPPARHESSQPPVHGFLPLLPKERSMLKDR